MRLKGKKIANANSGGVRPSGSTYFTVVSVQGVSNTSASHAVLLDLKFAQLGVAQVLFRERSADTFTGGGSGLFLDMLADGSLRFYSRTANNYRYDYTVTAAQVAALGITWDLNQVYSFYLEHAGGFFVNGLATKPETLNVNTSNVGAAIIKQPHFAGNYTLLSVMWFTHTTGSPASFYDKVKKYYNGGRGADARYIFGTALRLLFRLFRTTNTWSYAPEVNTTGQTVPGQLIHQDYANYSAGVTRRFGALVVTPARITPGTQLKDYFFEGAYPSILNLNLTGAWGRADEPGSTDFPNSLAGVAIDIAGNKWGGAAANVTTDSIITNARFNSFNSNAQTPLGWDRLDMEIGANIVSSTGIILAASRKTRVRFTTKNNQVFTVPNLNVNGNFLNQTFAELINFNYLRPVQFQVDLTSATQGANFTGTIQRPSDNNTGFFIVQNCGVTGYPEDFNNVSSLQLVNCKLTGVLRADKATVIQLSNGAATPTGQNITAGSNQIDCSNQTVSMTNLWAANCRLDSVLLPLTSGRTILSFFVPNNPDLLTLGLPTWNMFISGVSSFQVQNTGLNMIFPLGTVIRSRIINLSSLANLTLANLQATLDNWTSNLANFENNTILKTLTATGNVDLPLATADDLARLDRLRAAVRTTWTSLQLTAGGVARRWDLCNALGPSSASGPITDIICQVPSTSFLFILNNTVEITNSTSYNGTWTVVDRSSANDAALYDNAAGTTGTLHWFRLRRTGFDKTGMPAGEGGVISKI